jgi:hypothetical protein
MSEHFNIDRDELKHLPLVIYTDASYKASTPHYSQMLFLSKPYDKAARTSASIIILDPTKLKLEQEPLVIVDNINTDGHCKN